MKFEKLGQSGRARRGRLTLEHGVVETPCFYAGGDLRYSQRHAAT